MISRRGWIIKNQTNCLIVLACFYSTFLERLKNVPGLIMPEVYCLSMSQPLPRKCAILHMRSLNSLYDQRANHSFWFRKGPYPGKVKASRAVYGASRESNKCTA